MRDIFTGAAEPLTKMAFDDANDTLRSSTDDAAAIPVQAASLWAVLKVETRGFGYLPDKRPQILFERHIFNRRTRGVFDAGYPDLSNTEAGGYSGGAAEYTRLARAMQLDRKAAYESASWGLGQIMGFNATLLGYESAEDMVESFKAGEDAQLDATVRFITGNASLLGAFRSRNWARFAFFYNGKNYSKNRYDEKLAQYQSEYMHELPDIGIRAAQARLTYLGYFRKGIDGIWGDDTKEAVNQFQKANGLKVSDTLDTDTTKKLEGLESYAS